VDVDVQFKPMRNVANDFMQDRQAMKAGNFTGIAGIPNQDMAMWVTMGPIADRTHDRLGASDLAIVEFRRQMVEAVQSFMRGEPPIGVGPLRIPSAMCSYQAIVPKEVDWRDYTATPV
jgi:phthalate 4,5-dioxygenase oxygenase subunit